jgi:hypothetical protein
MLFTLERSSTLSTFSSDATAALRSIPQIVSIKLFFLINKNHKNPFELCGSFQSPCAKWCALSLKASFYAQVTPIIASLRSGKPQKKNPVLRTEKTSASV